MFKIMEITEQVYEGGTSSKTINRSDSNHAGYSRNKNRVEAVSPLNPEKGHAGKYKKRDAVDRNYWPTGGKHA